MMKGRRGGPRRPRRAARRRRRRRPLPRHPPRGRRPAGPSRSQRSRVQGEPEKPEHPTHPENASEAHPQAPGHSPALMIDGLPRPVLVARRGLLRRRDRVDRQPRGQGRRRCAAGTSTTTPSGRSTSATTTRLTSLDIRNSTVQGRDIALNTVTGEDVNEATLRQGAERRCWPTRPRAADAVGRREACSGSHTRPPKARRSGPSLSLGGLTITRRSCTTGPAMERRGATRRRASRTRSSPRITGPGEDIDFNAGDDVIGDIRRRRRSGRARSRSRARDGCDRHGQRPWRSSDANGDAAARPTTAASSGTRLRES